MYRALLPQGGEHETLSKAQTEALAMHQPY